MNEKIYNFTEIDIEEYLIKLKSCVSKNNFQISLNSNRKENLNFIENYNITDKKIRRVLIDLKVKDFCYAVKNRNPRYAHEVLYIFSKSYALYSFGNKESVDLYIKVNMLKKSKVEFIFIVSFHKLNFDIEFLFK